jgi:hypothetical protein
MIQHRHDDPKATLNHDALAARPGEKLTSSSHANAAGT